MNSCQKAKLDFSFCCKKIAKTSSHNQDTLPRFRYRKLLPTNLHELTRNFEKHKSWTIIPQNQFVKIRVDSWEENSMSDLRR
jgi:uncharacterized protein YaaW (UPF0174 family)